MATYWIIAVSWNGVDRSPLSRLFATPFQAETFHRNMHSHSGYAYTVRPATWREREAAMFDAVDDRPAPYQHPVWANERWWSDIAHHFKDYFVHISVNDPSAIAFTEDERKGEADRQTMMRPGKFLQKFLAAGDSGVIEHGPLKDCVPQVSKMQVAYYAAWHQTGTRPESDDVLAFTEDADEMVRLYEEGPDSCMMGKGWSKESHPVRVYAGGGLALAYLTSVSGEVIGRALCWPANECFGRVYPTPHSPALRDKYDELMARLKAKGWTSIEEDNSCFEGAKLSYITNRYDEVLMPYLDHSYGVREVYRDGKTWWEMTLDEPHQENTDGTLFGSHEPDWTCENCEEGFSDNEDSCSVYGYWRPTGTPDRHGHMRGYGRNESVWCDDCRSNNAFYCDGSSEYYVDSGEAVYPNDGQCYERNWFNANGGWQCCWSDEYFFKNDDPPVHLADGQLIHEDSLDQTFVCFYTGKRWLSGEQSSAVPGYHVSYDYTAEHPVEHENVMPEMPEDPGDVAVWAVACLAPLPAWTSSDPLVEAVYDELTAADEHSTVHVTPRAWADIVELLTERPVTIDLNRSRLSYDAACINP